MVHPQAYRQSEAKTIAAARQLQGANPAQLQLYTIQNDFTRSIYASGEWFNAHPECLLRDRDGKLVNHTQPGQKVGRHDVCQRHHRRRRRRRRRRQLQ